MARYRGSLCRICRREGVKLYLKGTKCDMAKCILERRNFAPGQHGKRRKKISEYGLQLREKQKLRKMYGITEKKFELYFKKASKKKGVTGSILLQMLETRLDNVVFRLGLAVGRRAARQIVRHGHIRIHDRRLDIPSYAIKIGDEISINEKGNGKKNALETLETTSGRPVPEWMVMDKAKIKGKVLRLPERGDISIPIDEHLIVELYSK